MPVIVNKEPCLGCGACIGMCPVEALAFDNEGKAECDSSKCIDCGACVAICPVEAISQQ